jgi:aminoglycoside phosphotransferase (APT) family kinase protein
VPRDLEDVEAELVRVLGGEVHTIRRLSGGASRITSAVDMRTADGLPRALILQQDRGGLGAVAQRVPTEASLLDAARAHGVPVPHIVAAGARDGLPRGWLVVERLDGESIPRKILRDEEFAGARQRLTTQLARALAAIHRIDPTDIVGLAPSDPLAQPLEFLDAMNVHRPVLELAARWLALHQPRATEHVLVHGDFRLGNFLVDRDGLCAVLDWELAHVGVAGEDVGWLCARAWRFDGPGRVGGFGDLNDFLTEYEEASGRTITPSDVEWWEAYALLKWAVICRLQAETHLSGVSRSVELATIGRRVCESEWDLLCLLGMATMDASTSAFSSTEVAADGDFGRPTSLELIEAVREMLDNELTNASPSRTKFSTRVARNALAIVEREIQFGSQAVVNHDHALAALGYATDEELAQALRSGRLDQELNRVGHLLSPVTRDQLLIANPTHISP